MMKGCSLPSDTWVLLWFWCHAPLMWWCQTATLHSMCSDADLGNAYPRGRQSFRARGYRTPGCGKGALFAIPFHCAVHFFLPTALQLFLPWCLPRWRLAPWCTKPCVRQNDYGVAVLLVELRFRWHQSVMSCRALCGTSSRCGWCLRCPWSRSC